MALTHGAKENGGSNAAEAQTAKPATALAAGSKVWWFNNLLSSTGIEPPRTGSSQNANASLGAAVDDVEPEAALEVGEDLALDDRRLSLAFTFPRHLEEIKGTDAEAQSWRMRERMKTVSVALVICLNVGVDPPDVTKTQPCARVECWVDPLTLDPQRALEGIGNNLQRQYERWQPRARYRQSLDPTVGEVRRLATGLRRNARDERVLFHYNGHGVPKPTADGEIWVFDRSYTQYIPLSLYDLQSWMGSPSIFVYDCSNAGIIVTCFEQFAEQHEREYLEQVNAQGVSSSDLPAPISPRNCIQLAACAANQLLPMNPDLPADLFTACLTTPIKMALRWFVMQNQGKLAPRITLEMLDKIPGQFGDRRTMLGELNWIFTAITDTIAWNTLPRPLFQKLFRQDLLVASLFRNFLLAERVMRSYDCNPVSQPNLPATHQHTMWQAWDLAVDMALSQLPGILDHDTPYRASTFFEEQLTAFEVWLKYGNERRPPPGQLPIVLQVLLSQAHRLRALDLLGRFLDLGPWAVNLALSVGIFPYVLKLLQSAARELRPLLVSIWAKILAVDTSCQNDLVRDASHKYFINVLQDECMMPSHRTWAAFVLACIVHNYRHGQQEAEQSNLIAICLEHLDDPEPVLRQWLAIAVGRVWDHYEPARWRGARDNAHEKLYELLKDPVPEVRAAAVFALGTFINSCDERTEHANNLDHAIALHLLKACEDGSPLVRRELVVALQYVVLAFESNFVNVCRAATEEEEHKSGAAAGGSLLNSGLNRTMSPASNTKRSNKDLRGASTLQPSSSSSCLDRLVGSGGIGILGNRSSGSLSVSMSALTFGNVYTKIYSGLVFLSSDPHFEVANMASKLIEFLRLKAIDKEAAAVARTALHTESASVPSSPARPSFMMPGTSINNLRPQQAGHVTPIAEESGGESLSTSADARSMGSARPHRMVRAGSVGRHPSGGQHATSATANNSHSSNTSLVLPPTAATASTVTAGPVTTAKPATNGARALATNPPPRQTAPPQLSTNFIPWSARYFTKQLMKHECSECDCDHESERHWRREWLFHRNNEVRMDAELQSDLLHQSNLLPPSRKNFLDGSISVVGAPTVLRNVPALNPSVILFHPFSHEVVIAGQSQVSVWNAQQARRVSVIDINERKSNKNAATPHISTVEYINAHDESLLLVSCDDGSIKIYRDYALETSSSDEESCSEDGESDLGGRRSSGSGGLNNNNDNVHKTRLVSAWNGIRDATGLSSQPLHRNTTLVSSMANLSFGNKSTGVKTAWSQADLTLAVGGSDSRYIRLWDASQELRRADLLTVTDAAITSLSFGPSHVGLLCAGFSDGSVRLYDVRSPDSRVMTFEGKGSPVLDCRLKGDEQHLPVLVYGDSAGVVNYYQLSSPQSPSRSTICLPSNKVTQGVQTLTGLSIHPRADIFAAWAQQSVNIHYYNPHISTPGTDVSGTSTVTVIKHHDEGVLGQRLGYEGCLAFHPYLLQIGIGSKDGAVSLKGLKKIN